jgi:tetratricopeptide (TPR) repeat protein
MATKLDFLQEKKLSPVDELREILSSLEESHVKIQSMDSTQVLTLLRDLDHVDADLKAFEANGLDLRPERSRFEMIQGRLRKRANPLLKAVGGQSVLREQRPTPAPPPEQWWWYIDEIIAAQRQRLLRRLGIGLVVLLLVIGGIILVFNTILAPSPEVVARLEAENEAYSAIEQGDYQEALAFVDEGLTQVPGDPSLLIIKGVLQQTLGEEEKAEQTFAQVQEALDDPKEFYLARGQLYLRLNQAEQAESDINAALELDEDFARTWLLLGQVLEIKGKTLEASQAYEKAGQLAFDQGENEIYVISRMALARLSQAPPPLPGEATVESGTPE